jgi:hypothetical protein
MATTCADAPPSTRREIPLVMLSADEPIDLLKE